MKLIINLIEDRKFIFLTILWVLFGYLIVPFLQNYLVITSSVELNVLLNLGVSVTVFYLPVKAYELYLWKTWWKWKQKPLFKKEYTIECTSSYDGNKYFGKAEVIQNMSEINIKTKFNNSTGGSEGTTVIAVLVYKNQEWFLLLNYSNSPQMDLRATEAHNHDGFSRLDIKLSAKSEVTTMKGIYSNYGRGTYGDIVYKTK